MKKIISENTVVIFKMSTPPLGWSRQDIIPDSMLRITDGLSSAVGSTFSEMFISDPIYTHSSITANASNWEISSHTLTTNELPNHRHNSPTTPGSYAGYYESPFWDQSPLIAPRVSPFYTGTTDNAVSPTNVSAQGTAHSHPVGDILNGLVLGSYSKPSFAIKYIDVITAIREP
jgi:hypothetical protein